MKRIWKLLVLVLVAAALICSVVIAATASTEGEVVEISEASQLKFSSFETGKVYTLTADNLVVGISGTGLTEADLVLAQPWTAADGETAEAGRIILDLNGKTLLISKRINVNGACLEIRNGTVITKAQNFLYLYNNCKVVLNNVKCVIGHSSAGQGTIPLMDVRSGTFEFTDCEFVLDTVWNGNQSSDDKNNATNGYYSFYNQMFTVGSGSSTKNSNINMTFKGCEFKLNAAFGQATVMHIGSVETDFVDVPTVVIDGCTFDVNATSVFNIAYTDTATSQDTALLKITGNTSIYHHPNTERNEGSAGIFTNYESVHRQSGASSNPNFFYLVIEEGVTLKGNVGNLVDRTFVVNDASAIDETNVQLLKKTFEETEGVEGAILADGILLYDETCTEAMAVSASEHITATFVVGEKIFTYKLPASGGTPKWTGGLMPDGAAFADSEGGALVSAINGWALTEGGEKAYSSDGTAIYNFDFITEDTTYYAIYENVRPYWAAFDENGTLLSAFGKTEMLNPGLINKNAARIEVYRGVYLAGTYSTEKDLTVNLNGNTWFHSGARDCRFNISDLCHLTVNGPGTVGGEYGRGNGIVYANNNTTGEMTFRCVDFDIDGAATPFDYRSHGNALFDSCTMVVRKTKTGAIFSLDSKGATADTAFTYNYTFKDTSFVVEEGAMGATYSLFSFGRGAGSVANFTFDGCDITTAEQGIFDFESRSATFNVDIYGATKLYTKSGKYFAATDAVEAKGSLRIDRDCIFGADFTDVTESFMTLSFFDFEKQEQIENCQIIKTGWDSETENYISTDFGYRVTWHIGEDTIVENYFAGIIPTAPSFEFPPRVEGNKLYVPTAQGWALTEGGEAVSSFEPVSSDIHYYALMGEEVKDLYYTVQYDDGEVEYSSTDTFYSGDLRTHKFVIKLYQNCTLCDNNSNGSWTSFKDGSVIDLNGFTLTMTMDASLPNGDHMAFAAAAKNSTLKIVSTAAEKGTLTRTSAKPYFYPSSKDFHVNTTYYFENVILSDGGINASLSDTRESVNFIFKRCELQLNTAGSTIGLGHRGSGNHKSTLWLEDTVINVGTGGPNYVFYMSSTNAGTRNWAADVFVKGSTVNTNKAFLNGQQNDTYYEKMNVYVDGDSTFNVGSFIMSEGGRYKHNEGLDEHNLYIAAGATFNADIFVNASTHIRNYTVKGYDAITIADGAATLGTEVTPVCSDNGDGTYSLIDKSSIVTYTLSYYRGDTLLASYDIIGGTSLADYAYQLDGDFYFEGGVPYTITSFEGWALTDGGEAVTLPDTITENLTYYMVGITGEKAAYAWFDAEGALIGSSSSTQLDKAHLTKVPNGGKMVFYTDIEYVGAAYLSFTAGVTATLDLNSFTFTKTGANATSSDSARINLLDSQTITIKNGTVVTDIENFIYCQDNATVNIENVTINSKAFDTGKLNNKGAKIFNSAAIFDFRAGTLNITDCTINSNTGLGNSAYRGGTPKFTFTRVEINVDVLDGLAVVYVIGCNPGYDSVASSSHTLIDCKINAPEVNALYGVGGKIDSRSTPSLKVIGCEINCKTILSTTSSVNTTYAGSYYFENTKLSTAPVATIGEVTYAEGSKVFEFAGEAYPVVIAKTPEISVNLTLENKLNLNLYIPEDSAITKLTLGGVEYTLADLTAENGSYVITKALVSSEAAEDIAIGVTFSVLGAACTDEITYSVVDYATEILSGEEYAALKPLMCAVINYIDAAYDYFGSAENAKLEALVANTELYTAPAEEIPTEAGDTAALSAKISSASLSVQYTYVRLVFNVKTEALEDVFTLKIGEQVLYSGKAYDGRIVIALEADMITESISIVSGEASGSYSFANYASAIIDTAEAKDAAMLKAVYNYALAAKAYSAQ